MSVSCYSLFSQYTVRIDWTFFINFGLFSLGTLDVHSTGKLNAPVWLKGVTGGPLKRGISLADREACLLLAVCRADCRTQRTCEPSPVRHPTRSELALPNVIL